MSVSSESELFNKTRLFSLPDVKGNTAGWGPVEGPAEMQEVPFAPYDKTNKLGRVSDWISTRFYQNNRLVYL